MPWRWSWISYGFFLSSLPVLNLHLWLLWIITNSSLGFLNDLKSQVVPFSDPQPVDPLPKAHIAPKMTLFKIIKWEGGKVFISSSFSHLPSSLLFSPFPLSSFFFSYSLSPSLFSPFSASCTSLHISFFIWKTLLVPLTACNGNSVCSYHHLCTLVFTSLFQSYFSNKT